MLRSRRMTRLPLLLPLALLACSGTPTDPSASSTGTASEAATSPASTSTSTSPVAAEPMPVPEPTPTPSVEPPAAPPAPSNPNTTFQLAALREGPVQLVVSHGDALLLASGQPIPIDAQGQLRPDPALAKGLTPRLATYGYMFETIAFGGSLAGEAWVTTRQEHDRAATEYDVHVLRGGRWQRQALEKGPLVEYYGAYVEIGDALLGLRGYATNPLLDVFESEEESDEAAAFARSSAAALAKAKPGFVHLAGPAPLAMPRVPAKHDVIAAVTSDAGTLYALARPTGGEPGETQLLVWLPGKADAEPLALPGFGSDPTLAASGALVLIGDSEQIGIVRGSALETIDRSDLPDEVVGSLAASPAGDLWVVLGDHPFLGEGDSEQMWFRPAATPSWTKVELPSPQGPLATPGPRMAWDPEDEGWSERERDPITSPPMVSSVVFAHGAVWAVADLGQVWDSSLRIVRRNGVYTTLPGPREVVELEPVDHTQVRQYAALGEGQKPGSEHCPYVELVLGEGADEVAITTKLGEAGLVGNGVFVGEVDGKRERVLSLAPSDRETLATLPKLLAGMTGVTIDCRPHRYVETSD